MQSARDNHLIALLKESCVNFLQVVTVSAGLTKNNLHHSSMHSLSALLCTELKQRRKEWCDLTLIRSIAQTQQIRRAFSTKPWIDVLLGFLLPTGESYEIGLPKQVFVIKFWSFQFKIMPFTLDFNRASTTNSINVLGFGQS